MTRTRLSVNLGNILSFRVALTDPSHKQNSQLRSNLRHNACFRVLAHRTLRSIFSRAIGGCPGLINRALYL